MHRHFPYVFRLFGAYLQNHPKKWQAIANAIIVYPLVATAISVGVYRSNSVLSESPFGLQVRDLRNIECRILLEEARRLEHEFCGLLWHARVILGSLRENHQYLRHSDFHYLQLTLEYVSHPMSTKLQHLRF